MKRIHGGSWLFILAFVSFGSAQQSVQAPDVPAQAFVERPTFQVMYVNGSNAYIDGGRGSGLAEGTKLILKQDPQKPATDKTNIPIEPGIIATLKVIATASTSAVCEVIESSRAIVPGDVISLPDEEVQKLVEKNTMGNTRQYPMVVSFNEGDPLDEEERETVPRPPLPEVNQLRGRIGFDISAINQLGNGGISTRQYGMMLRADFTRMFGTYWNLNGFWREELQSGSTPTQPTLQNLMNRTYLMSMTYTNPTSRWTAGIGRLYLPWASSLETIDGAYIGRQIATNETVGVFAGSTPDPSAWDYNPQRRIGGVLFNARGGSFDNFKYSTTVGFGVEMLKWTIDRPFVFTENNLSYEHRFSFYESMQIDRPTANVSMPPVAVGVGQSLISMRVQVHPRVSVDLSDTYFRDVPTYNLSLVGTGLLDKYLYQGINGGGRIDFPLHIAGYFSLGSSSDSSDPKNSLNKLIGGSMSNIWKTRLMVDARYSQFDSSFAAGTYSTITVSRDLIENLRFNLQAGRYAYSSTVAASSASDFINLTFDTNIGSKLFLESMFTAQRGGSLNYNQWTTTVGYRFNNRASERRTVNARHP